jgi:hypothetical protein
MFVLGYAITNPTYNIKIDFPNFILVLESYFQVKDRIFKGLVRVASSVLIFVFTF